jgi:integrase
MDSQASLILDRRYKNKDDTYRISLKIYHKGEKRYINLKEYCSEDFWDQQNGKVLKGAKVFPSLLWVNEKIQGKKIEANKIIASLEESGQLDGLTPGELIQRIQNKSAHVSFSSYLDNMISEFKMNGNDGQAVIHKNLKSFLIRYGAGEKDYKFSDINYKLLKSIEGKFKPRIAGCSNGLAVHLRAIRAIWNRAIKDGTVRPDGYPFKIYTIKTSKTHKTAIKQDIFRKIRELSLPEQTHAWHGRNMFFFSFFCRGMNFADIAKLKLKNITNGRITYVRSKTKKEISVKLNKNINDILKLYLDDKNQNSYIFPVITDFNQVSEQITAYQNVVNRALKRWAKKMDTDRSLSFNTARHSWATIGKELHLPIAVISEGLGHADISTTQIYLDDFDTDVIDDANDLITF